MERTNCLGNEGDNNNSLSSGVLWPQRNYTCSFCKRQFNSAQALGGHMNVHRRDRAMLIQLPSWVFDCPNANANANANPNPNPNPNSNFPYSSTSLSSSSSSSPYSPTNKMLPVNYPHNYSLPSFTATSFSSALSYHENKKSNLESPRSQDFGKKKMKKSMRSNDLGVEEFNNNIKDFSQKCELDVLKKKNEVISLDLEIGCKDPKEVLDLELRLGCF